MSQTVHQLLAVAASKTHMVYVMQTRLRAGFYPRPLLVVAAIAENKAAARRDVSVARWLRRNS